MLTGCTGLGCAFSRRLDTSCSTGHPSGYRQTGGSCLTSAFDGSQGNRLSAGGHWLGGASARTATTKATSMISNAIMIVIVLTKYRFMVISFRELVVRLNHQAIYSICTPHPG